MRVDPDLYLKAHQYVLGFAFERSNVLLVQKLRGPPGVAGRLNGIGGRLRAGEFPFDGMARKAREDAGLEGTPGDWIYYGVLVGSDWVVHLFARALDRDTARALPVGDARTHAPECDLGEDCSCHVASEPLDWYAVRRVCRPSDPISDALAAGLAPNTALVTEIGWRAVVAEREGTRIHARIDTAS